MLNVTEQDVLNAFYNYELTEDDLIEAYELGFISDNTMNLLISEKRDDFFDVVDNFSNHIASKIHGSKPEPVRKETIKERRENNKFAHGYASRFARKLAAKGDTNDRIARYKKEFNRLRY